MNLLLNIITREKDLALTLMIISVYFLFCLKVLISLLLKFIILYVSLDNKVYTHAHTRTHTRARRERERERSVYIDCEEQLKMSELKKIFYYFWWYDYVGPFTIGWNCDSMCDCKIK